MLLFLVLFISPVISIDWQETLLTPGLFNYSTISPQCTKDMKTWISSLQAFSAETGKCVSGSKTCNPKILESNLYAVQQLDSFGKFPASGMLELTNTFDGSYQECERINGIKYDTNYCYITLFPRHKLPIGSSLPYRGAVCMPKSCQHHDIPNLYNQIDTKLFYARIAFCSKRVVEKNSGFWGFSVFMIIMIIIAILATIVDFIREKTFDISSSDGKNLFLRILLTFSFWTNAGQILSVKDHKPGFIRSLDCMRTFSMSWVVAGHSLMYFSFSDASLPISKVPNLIWNHIFLNAVFSVDTFFLLSGVVVSYLFFKNRPKLSTMKSPLTWILFYLHRYLRLTPPYMLFVGFFTVYGPYIQGPYSAWMWNVLIRQTDSCANKWWRNLIYINNFDNNQRDTCYGVSWYLATDTQLYLAAPIILIGLYYSLAAGSILIVAGSVGSVIATYVIYGAYDMAADSYHDDPSGQFTNLIYQMPWIRCTPYLIGLLVGYCLATYGKRQIRLNFMLSIIGWTVAFGIGIACLFSNYDYDKGSYWSAFSRATFYNFSRIGWSLSISWVIIANHMGWGGPIDNFMSHPIWQPFGRLSYCAYIVHWMVLYYFLNIGDKPIHFFNTWQVYTYYAIPATVLSFVAAFFWSCLFEVSTLKIEKMMIEAIIGTQTKKQTAIKPVEEKEKDGEEGEREGEKHTAWKL